MGEVVVLKPVSETLIFKDAAEAKALTLLQQMINAMRRLKAAERNDFSDADHTELVELQKEFHRATARFTFITEMLEDAELLRSELWETMPDAISTTLIASNADVSRSVIMFAERNCAQITCRDFEMIEATEQGVMPLFRASQSSK